MVSELLALLVWNLSLVLQVLLVTDENSRDIFLSMLIDFAHPLGDLGERFSISDIVGDNNTVGTLIITAGDGLESLLTSGIPNLQFDLLSVHVDRSDFEVHSDCGHEIIVENIILNYAVC